MAPRAERASGRAAHSTADEVSGERRAAAFTRRLSLQARVSNLLALGLMIVLGLGLLGWYYAHALTRPTRARQSAQARAAGRTQGEAPLPSLGPILPPDRATMFDASAREIAIPSANPPATLASAVAMPSLSALPPAPVVPPGAPGAAQSVPARPRELTALERRLQGEVFIATDHPPGTGVAAAAESAAVSAPAAAVSSAGSELQRLLVTEPTAPVGARVLPTQRLLLPKGAFIDCTLETALDSSLPGMTSCVTASDTFSADGSVVLLDRGTKLVGETRGQVQQGTARVFVVWTQARTPSGVIVPLDSPGADELGRSGLPGQVERHFWQRFGAAILISSIDGAIQAAVQSSAQRGGTVIYNPSASSDVMSEVLKSTLSIAPTVVKRNGDRVQVLVARDVDFSSVYELRHTHEQP